MSMAVHYSSAKQDWETPSDLFAKLHAEFYFTLDACATKANAKVPHYYSPDTDALIQTWSGVVWMNPPYGRGIGQWVRKAYDSAQMGATVVCLLPARTDTSWWHDYVMMGEVRFLRGRIRFVNAPYAAPFPSAIVVFRP